MQRQRLLLECGWPAARREQMMALASTIDSYSTVDHESGVEDCTAAVTDAWCCST